MPELVTAGNSAALHFCSYAGFIPEKGEYWLYLEVDEGSWGGRKGRDGMDSVDNLMANTRNNPIEELDMRFPMRCDRYELRDDPAAPGQWRGGIGIVRTQPLPRARRVLVRGRPAHRPAARHLRRLRRAAGARSTYIKADGTEQDIPAKVTGLDLRHRRHHPARPSPARAATATRSTASRRLVLDDVLDDFTTIELAREAYGVVIDEASMAVDDAATDELRARLRSERGEGFQGELLSLVSTPHPLAMSPHR